MSKEEKRLKLQDIQSIDFGTNLAEIISSLEILITLFGNDMDADIVEACRLKLEEGFGLLRDWGTENQLIQLEE